MSDNGYNVDDTSTRGRGAGCGRVPITFLTELRPGKK
jgi:hypothetical protein